MAGRKQVRRGRSIGLRRPLAEVEIVQEEEEEVEEDPSFWDRKQASVPRLQQVLTDMGVDLRDFERRYDTAITRRRGPGSRTAAPSTGEIDAYKNYQRTRDYGTFQEELAKLHGWERGMGQSLRDRTRAVIERIFLWEGGPPKVQP